MKRKLLKQIRNEWRSNTWLALELLIVSVVMWFLTDYLYTNISIINQPRGFNTEHCYLIRTGQLNDKSPDYVPGQSYADENAEILTLLDRLEKRPEIEAVAMGQNAYPYNNSNSGSRLAVDTFTSSGYITRRIVSPEYTRVFRIRGANGETPEQLAEKLKEPDAFIVSDNLFRRKYKIEHMSDFIGKEFAEDSMNDTMTLKASYVPIRYNDYSPAEWSLSVMFSPTRDNYAGFLNELFVRVRDNMDKDFIENLMKDATTNLRIGNTYISSVQSFDSIREVHQRDHAADMRSFVTGIAFLALNIFLGLLGTFWFRTQQRVPEIAIRKANGATPSDIFRRVIGEGLLLLLVVTPFAWVIDYLLTYYELNTYFMDGYFVASRFVICAAISWALMAVMIILGIFIPAKRAMKIAPAKALMAE